jgi:hypothetical protein
MNVSNSLEYFKCWHKKFGWEVMELRGPIDGHRTQYRKILFIK